MSKATNDGMTRLGILIVVAVLLHGCGFRGGEGSGRVLEVTNRDDAPSEWELAPIADADVLVVWYGDRFSLVHSTSVCLRAKSTKTNRDGSFATSSWWGRPRFMALTGVRAVIFVAKEGHAHVVQRQGEPPWPAEPGVHLLYRVEDSTEWPVDRFLSGSCPPAIFEPPA